MCCLFGMLDYKGNLTVKQQNKILSVLSAACEERGKDATGIAYNHADKLCIYKRPLPAHFICAFVCRDMQLPLWGTPV